MGNKRYDKDPLLMLLVSLEHQKAQKAQVSLSHQYQCQQAAMHLFMQQFTTHYKGILFKAEEQTGFVPVAV
jgi:hypothetical protein